MVLMGLFSGQEWRCPCREWTCGHSGGERECGTKGEMSINIYAGSGVRCGAGERLLCGTGNSLVLCDDLERWDETRGGKLGGQGMCV